MVAFANADGGELIVGIEDDGTITGTDEFSLQEVSEIKDAPRTHVHKDTPLQSVLYRETVVEQKRVLYFRIPKGTRLIHLTSDGRCLRRNDLETVPVAAEQIQFDRQEVRSREYDREFVDGASIADLDPELLKVVAEQIAHSTDKCLQYLGLAELDANSGMRVRRAALLLFGKATDRWHPRVQVRILKVSGTDLGTGSAYNVTSDSTVRTNIVRLIDEAWDALRPHLVATRFQEDARFRATYIYPEIACREALVNAIAHRDYSEEGRGIEIYIFDDRIEIRNSGGLLSSISIADISALKGAHQSRNSYIARALREIGIMRELGEGMRRIFELMRSNELAQPEIKNEVGSFTLSLHHRPMYSKDGGLWLEQYDKFKLSAEEKAVMLMGRQEDLISPNDIIRKLGIVDTEHYRQIVASLQDKGILTSGIQKRAAHNLAKKRGVGQRDIPRFKIVPVKDISTGRDERRVLRASPEKPERRSPAPKNAVETIGGEKRALFVANIPPNTNERDMISAFKDVGDLDSVKIPRTNGLSRGYAFLEFVDPANAEKALTANVHVGGRRLSTRWSLPRRPK